jgi:hypothetical protein
MRRPGFDRTAAALIGIGLAMLALALLLGGIP